MTKKKWEGSTLVKQICDYCGHVFYSYRIKKYCGDVCAGKANKLLSQIRYDKLRRALLESQQQQTGKEVIKK